jgi:hypothetical protein
MFITTDWDTSSPRVFWLLLESLHLQHADCVMNFISTDVTDYVPKLRSTLSTLRSIFEIHDGSGGFSPVFRWLVIFLFCKCSFPCECSAHDASAVQTPNFSSRFCYFYIIQIYGPTRCLVTYNRSPRQWEIRNLLVGDYNELTMGT